MVRQERLARARHTSSSVTPAAGQNAVREHRDLVRGAAAGAGRTETCCALPNCSRDLLGALSPPPPRRPPAAPAARTPLVASFLSPAPPLAPQPGRVVLHDQRGLQRRGGREPRRHALGRAERGGGAARGRQAAGQPGVRRRPAGLRRPRRARALGAGGLPLRGDAARAPDGPAGEARRGVVVVLHGALGQGGGRRLGHGGDHRRAGRPRGGAQDGLPRPQAPPQQDERAAHRRLRREPRRGGRRGAEARRRRLQEEQREEARRRGSPPPPPSSRARPARLSSAASTLLSPLPSSLSLSLASRSPWTWF